MLVKVFPTQPKERWRAEKGEEFFWICDTMNVGRDIDRRTGGDDILWEEGNYFQTKAQAESALEKMKELLRSLHQ